MKRFLLAAAAVTDSLAVPAQAADLARPAPPVYAPPPPIIAVFTWTGCYVGGNGGGLWSQKTFTNTNFIPAFAGVVPGFGPVFLPAVAAGADFGSQTVSGGLGGGQIGCNYQVANWVFGIQGDYSWTNANSNTANTIIPAVVGGPVIGLTDSTQHNSLAAVTGRIGYSWDRLLGYVKAGGAWLNTSYAFQVNGVNVASDSATRTGWTVGVGAEYAFLNWLTGFVEYDYYGFSSVSPAGLVCATGAPCGFVTNSVGITNNVNVVKAGLNFKFGPGSF